MRPGEQHTPGPWTITAIATNEELVPVAIIGQMDRPEGMAGITDAFTVCMVPLQGNESKSNISLICASPVMFGALKMVRRSANLSPAMAEHIDAVLGLATAGVGDAL